MASILLRLNHVPDEQQFAQIEIGGCMKSISVQSEGVAFDTRVGTTRFSVLERMVLRRAHPISMMIGAAGAIWAVAFLWQNNWQWALVAIIGSRLAAYVVLRNANLPAIAEEANAIRRSLGTNTIQGLTKLYRASIEWGLAHRSSTLSAALDAAVTSGIDMAAGDRYISMYVNDNSLDFDQDIRTSISLLFSRAQDMGLCKTPALSF
jgi:hypothetical protein